MLRNVNINKVFERHMQADKIVPLEQKKMDSCSSLSPRDPLPFFDASKISSETTDPILDPPRFCRLENLSEIVKANDIVTLKSSEIEFILKSLDEYCDHEGVKFFPKKVTGITRSFSILKLQDGYEILLKPRIKNTSLYVKTGSYKIVKRGAAQIVVSLDKQQIISVSPQVTVSKDRDGHKNDELDMNGLLREGFHRVAFRDNNTDQDRIIYSMPDLGEPIDSPEGADIFRSLLPDEQKRVCLELIQQAKDLNAFDIKSANVLISSTGKISIIDHDTKIFTFTPSTFIHGVAEGLYDSETEKTCEEARILSLTIVLLMLIDRIYWNHYGRQFSYDEFKIPSKQLQEIIYKKSKGESERPLVKVLVQAYDCKLSYEDLICAVESSFLA